MAIPKGYRFSDEYRENMRRVAKERGFGKWCKGRQLSPEHRANIGKAVRKRLQASGPTEAQRGALASGREKRDEVNQARWDAARVRKEEEQRAYRERNVPRISGEDRERYGKQIVKAVRTFGMTADEYKAMVGAHDGRCAMCSQERPLVLDHCHQTGRVRGLLCHPCNVGLGKYEKYRTLAELFLRREPRWWMAEQPLPRQDVEPLGVATVADVAGR